MKRIPLTQNQFALVDDADFELLNQFKWSAGWCPRRKVYRAFRIVNNKSIYMHAFIMGTPKGKKTDHIDHNTLNNQRSNLRVCTNSQNLMNQRKRPDNTSGFKGVVWHRRDKKWNAYIMKNYKHIHLGGFTDKLEAARAYNRAAKEMFGEFAFLNDLSAPKQDKGV